MWRTSTKLQTLAPAWSEAQEVPLSRRRALLHVVLFDWDKVGAIPTPTPSRSRSRSSTPTPTPTPN